MQVDSGGWIAATESTGNGISGNGYYCYWNGVTAGSHTITVQATDSNGHTGAASETVTGVNVIYVNGNNPDSTGNGSSWATAYSNLATACNRAYSLTLSGYDIWVAQGIYGYNEANQNVAQLQINSLYGGFSGSGGETVREQRNWVSYPTILDGGNLGQVVEFSMARQGRQ